MAESGSAAPTGDFEAEAAPQRAAVGDSDCPGMTELAVRLATEPFRRRRRPESWG